MKVSGVLSVALLLASSGCAERSTVVLVNGAWMGAWAWDEVKAELVRDGYRVEAVELEGHGVDATPAPNVSLDGYVERVAQVVADAQTPVVLVGHSMSGSIITQVAAQAPKAVDALVYVAAFVPADGQSVQDLAATDADSQLGPLVQVDPAAAEIGLKLDGFARVFCDECDETNKQRLEAKYRPEPLAPFGTKAHYDVASWQKVPRHYVFTENDLALSNGLQHRMVNEHTWASTHSLASGHSPFLSQPKQLAATISLIAH